MGKLVVQFGTLSGEVKETIGYAGGKLGRKIWTRDKFWKLLILFIEASRVDNVQSRTKGNFGQSQGKPGFLRVRGMVLISCTQKQSSVMERI